MQIGAGGAAAGSYALPGSDYFSPLGDPDQFLPDSDIAEEEAGSAATVEPPVTDISGNGGALPAGNSSPVAQMIKLLESYEKAITQKINDNIAAAKDDEKAALKRKLEKVQEKIDALKAQARRLADLSGSNQAQLLVESLLTQINEDIGKLTENLDIEGADKLLGKIEKRIKEAETLLQEKTTVELSGGSMKTYRALELRKKEFVAAAGGGEAAGDAYDELLRLAHDGKLTRNEFNRVMTNAGLPEFNKDAWNAMMGGSEDKLLVVTSVPQFLKGVTRLWQTVRIKVGDDSPLDDLIEGETPTAKRNLTQNGAALRQVARETNFIFVTTEQIARLGQEIIGGQSKMPYASSAHLWEWLAANGHNSTITGIAENIDDSRALSPEEKWTEFTVCLLSELRHNCLAAEKDVIPGEEELSKSRIFERLMKAVASGEDKTVESFKDEFARVFFGQDKAFTFFDAQKVFDAVPKEQPRAQPAGTEAK
ncbi:MAG TPA: hypothetical protein VMT55_04785 [Candidatus Sulfotelmatobacter sp.]|nr:hypothetical protein [Candidatus Sulfotelmatobacter sp.]